MMEMKLKKKDKCILSVVKMEGLNPTKVYDEIRKKSWKSKQDILVCRDPQDSSNNTSKSHCL
ncbi:MAG: hypothetical protein N2V78_07390 [Methanophagales archaeon]|nr:hypothetical protein [Methanophagales archaeon]